MLAHAILSREPAPTPDHARVRRRRGRGGGDRCSARAVRPTTSGGRRHSRPLPGCVGTACARSRVVIAALAFLDAFFGTRRRFRTLRGDELRAYHHARACRVVAHAAANAPYY